MSSQQQEKVSALQRHLAALPPEQTEVDVKILAELFDLTVFITRRVVLFSGRRPTAENLALFRKAEEATVRLTGSKPREG